MKALVVFTQRPIQSFVSKLLHKDFQHVYVVLSTDKGLIKIDTTVDNWRVEHTDNGFYTQEGNIVVPVTVKKHIEFGIFGLHSCVAIVKRIIGLNKPFIFTPYQLYKELTKWDYSARVDNRQKTRPQKHRNKRC